LQSMCKIGALQSMCLEWPCQCAWNGLAINLQHPSFALLLCLLCVSGCACPLLYEMPERAVARRDERCVGTHETCQSIPLLHFLFTFFLLFLLFLLSRALPTLSCMYSLSTPCSLSVSLSLSLSLTHTTKTCMHQIDRLTHKGRWGGTALKDAQRGGHKAVQDLLTKAGATYGYDDTSQVLVTPSLKPLPSRRSRLLPLSLCDHKVARGGERFRYSERELDIVRQTSERQLDIVAASPSCS